jgi:hypothetical protein
MKPTQNNKEEKASLYSSLLLIKIGNEVLNQFDKEMSKRKFTYKDFQQLQNDYEKVVEEEVNKGKAQGILSAQKEEIEFLETMFINRNMGFNCVGCDKYYKERMNKLKAKLKQGDEK